MVRTLRLTYPRSIGLALALLALSARPVHAQCEAQAGVLFAELNPACFAPPATVIAAAYNVLPVIPQGFGSVFLLTNGPDLVVRDVQPYASFIAPSVGLYHLHTLVFDSANFDPASIHVDVTTLFQLEGLLQQGGGERCGALDMTGAEVRVMDCTECPAKPGSLAAYKSKDCLLDDTWIGAIPNGDASVPAGYQVAYVFTTGADQVILGRSAEPWFHVTAPGTYYIHTIVYDPATLDLSLITPGVTTAAEVNAWLVQGGGTICAGLDLLGAWVIVDDPGAGMLSVPAPNVCLEHGEAVLTVTPSGGLNVPPGFNVVYLLAQGTQHVLVGLSPDPSFTVASADYYSIHTLVYDESTLDLGNITLGVTTVAQVNGWLTQGGGGICASLDTEGAQVKTDECEKECHVSTGCLRALDPITCLHDGDAGLWAQPGVHGNVPPGYTTAYVLTRGWDLTIEQVSSDPQFTVHHLGLYRIHTLVYDPATLDLSTIQLGTTTAAEVNALLQQGGGTICAALDLRGACYAVLGPWWCGWWDCHQHRMAEGTFTDQVAGDAGMLRSVENDTPVAVSAWPNPVVDALAIDVTAFAGTDIQVDVLDLAGRSVVAPRRLSVAEGATRITLPMDALQAGTYLVRVATGDHQQAIRVVKAGR